MLKTAVAGHQPFGQPLRVTDAVGFAAKGTQRFLDAINGVGAVELGGRFGAESHGEIVALQIVCQSNPHDALPFRKTSAPP